MNQQLSSERVYLFSISLSYKRCEAFYRPGNNSVIVTADTGHRVQIPSSRLRTFVTKQGIQGRFRMIINNNNKIVSFEKIG
ncbi:DUF2835 domain-containing protein [Alteromonas ponticola]|uniref:DUF2835 domain-containing protein n=1 Tax=Alteromonas aquimaris TaxID=2998417 RepID=A0ABT3P6R7_9ALTE|nr:DUF2835 family protein [Alteromonas aquimaris]MCW8108453.1 DUF2835 domain-containing protein [Alteromonas aquimaris]